ncbi:MAG TPA: hypothetical protein ENI23_01410 [bacterium]|nr:hypothetical protein [bacterium]
MSDTETVEREKKVPDINTFRERVSYIGDATEKTRGAIETGSIEEEGEEIFSGSRGVFWAIHKSNIGDNPELALQADNASLEPRRTASIGAERIDEQVGSTRREVVNVGGFPNVLPDYLEEVEIQMFDLVDEGLEASSDWTENEKLGFLSYVEALQTIAHLPYDASGRTIEDFMVYLAGKMDIDLSLTRTPYRGYIGGFKISKANRTRGEMRRAVIDGIFDSFMDKKDYPQHVQEDANRLGVETYRLEDEIKQFVSEIGSLGEATGGQALEDELATYFRVRLPKAADGLVDHIRKKFIEDDPEFSVLEAPLMLNLTMSIKSFSQLLGEAREVEYHSVPEGIKTDVEECLAQVVFAHALFKDNQKKPAEKPYEIAREIVDRLRENRPDDDLLMRLFWEVNKVGSRLGKDLATR